MKPRDLTPSFPPLVQFLPQIESGPTSAPWLGGTTPAPEPLFAASPPPVLVDEADVARQIEEAMADARSEARAEVEEKAWAAAKSEIEAAIARLGEAVAQVEGTARSMTRPYATELVELAMIVARELVGAEIERDPAPLAQLVERCLEDVAGEASMTIRLHPADRALLAAARPDLIKSEVRVAEDPALARGGCVVESSRRLVDARLEERLDNLRDGLRELLKETEHAPHA